MFYTHTVHGYFAARIIIYARMIGILLYVVLTCDLKKDGSFLITRITMVKKKHYSSIDGEHVKGEAAGVVEGKLLLLGII